MKQFISILYFLILFVGQFSFAGGVHCRECPAETINCLPRHDCKLDRMALEKVSEEVSWVNSFEQGLCPQYSTLSCQGEMLGSACDSGGSIGACYITPTTEGGACFCAPIKEQSSL